jgi:hypothetical protein
VAEPRAKSLKELRKYNGKRIISYNSAINNYLEARYGTVANEY